VPATARDLERVVAGTVQSSATHLVTIRYLAGVTTKTRVVWDAAVVGDRGAEPGGTEHLAGAGLSGERDVSGNRFVFGKDSPS
jgi:hypothetical protein